MYFFIGNNAGVKLLNDYTYDHPQDLLKSPAWGKAREEYSLLQEAYPSGVSPKPLGIGAVKYNGYWWAGIYMEHLRGRELECVGNYKTIRIAGLSVRDYLIGLLNAQGVYHSDLHEKNIIVRTGRKGNITYVKAIDFSPGFVSSKRKQQCA